jgi:hypothetical protein
MKLGHKSLGKSLLIALLVVLMASTGIVVVTQIGGNRDIRGRAGLVGCIKSGPCYTNLAGATACCYGSCVPGLYPDMGTCSGSTSVVSDCSTCTPTSTSTFCKTQCNVRVASDCSTCTPTSTSTFCKTQCNVRVASDCSTCTPTSTSTFCKQSCSGTSTTTTTTSKIQKNGATPGINKQSN